MATKGLTDGRWLGFQFGDRRQLEISCMPSCYVTSEKATAWEDRYPPELGTDTSKAAFSTRTACCCIPVSICETVFVCVYFFAL
jgi:hypothetical protein